METSSDEGEEDHTGDLSHLGEAAPLRFQTAQQDTAGTSTSTTYRGCSNFTHMNKVRADRDVNINNPWKVFLQCPGQGQSGGEKRKEQARIEKLRQRTLSRIQEWTPGMVKTSALDKVMEKLNKGIDWITIRGSPGEGKTTVGVMALEELHKQGRDVFLLTSPKEFSQVISSYQLSVIMLDDVFGDLEFDIMKWNTWKDVLHQVLSLKEHRSHEKQTKKFVTVILIGREYVLKTAYSHMGRMADYFTEDEYVVNMSHTTVREIQEKYAIWQAVSDSSGIELDESTVNTICLINVPHGFPHVCRLFVTIRRSSEITAEEFFKTPMEFLNRTILLFMKDKLKLILFKELIKGDEKVGVRELGKLDSGYETIQIAHDLVGTYLRKENDYFVFDHPSIYDSVAYNICKLYPLYVIDNCNLSFIHERVRIEPSRDIRQETSESGLVVCIPRCYIQNLAKRFAAEIKKQNLLQVFSYTEFRYELVTKEVMSKLPPLSKLITRTDGKTNEEFLSLTASNKSRQLLMYVHDHIGRQLTEDEISTVLYGVCKYAASDVLNYMTQIYDTLDINVKYGHMKQTPLIIAAETRESQFVQDILLLNPDVNACDKFGCSPLYYACHGNQTEIVKLLLDRGVMFGGEVVKVACMYGSVEVVNLLFESGATVNMISNGDSPLQSACQTGNKKVIRYLIDKGASVNVQSERSHSSPLQIACFYNKYQAVQYLLDLGADKDSRDNMGNTPLHTAAAMGSQQCVDVLLKAGANVNVQNEHGNTPLHTAAERGFQQYVDVLLKAGANVNVQNKDGNTPLYAAAERGFQQYVDVLLKAGANVNVQNEHGNTPLHSAALMGSHPCVDVLLKAGANVNVQNEHGNTPLHSAALKGSHPCVDVLLKVGANVNVQNKDGNTPLYEAAERGFQQYVDVLLKAGANVNVQNKDGTTPLHTAAASGYHPCVDVLLKAGADVNVQNKDGNTPLHEAAASGSHPCVDVLLKAGADVNVQNIHNTPLHWAAASGSRPCVDVLLKAGANVNVQNEHGNTPLHSAALKGSHPCVDVLLKAGANVNVQNEHGNTPLHSAALKGSHPCVDVLLKAGANVNVQNKDGNTPLYEAAASGSRPCVDVLLKAGADVNVLNIHANTPLHEAALKGSHPCVDVLLKAGANVNVQNIHAFTPLHWAALKDSQQCVDVLLKAGANVNVQDIHAITPLHWAAASGSRPCVDVLLKAGADVNVQNNNAITPLHEAALQGSPLCVDVLLKAGANVNVQNKDGNTPLHTAAARGFHSCVYVLLMADADVNVQNKYKQTPMHVAVFFDPIKLPDEYVCDTLIRHRSDTNKQDTEGNTPLHLLCRVDSNTEIDKDNSLKPASSYEDEYRTLLTLFIDNGADVNILNNRGEPALHGWCKTLVRRKRIKTK